MTKREAAYILDPETTREALRPYDYDHQRRIAVVEEACALAAQALREDAEDEEKGRLVHLPCGIHNTVYIVEEICEWVREERPGHHLVLKNGAGYRVVSGEIKHITIDGATGKPVYDVYTETKRRYFTLEPSKLYLTREAAEAALRGDIVRACDVRLELTWDEEAARAALMETENEKRKEGVST